jgi:hypothetical protein
MIADSEKPDSKYNAFVRALKRLQQLAIINLQSLAFGKIARGSLDKPDKHEHLSGGDKTRTDADTPLKGVLLSGVRNPGWSQPVDWCLHYCALHRIISVFQKLSSE